MDVVIFESCGREFTIRDVWFFQKILELKEKIQESQQIPIASQTLLFNGMAMADDRYVDDYKITSGCRVQLQLLVDAAEPEPEVEEEEEEEEQPGRKTTTLIIDIAVSKKRRRRFAVECDAAAETVGQLKKRIGGSSSSSGRFVLSVGGNELRDDAAALADCGVPPTGSVVSVAAEEPPKVPLRINIDPEYSFDEVRGARRKKYSWEEGKEYSSECGVDDTAARLKERIAASHGIPADRFALLVGGYELPDGATLSDYSLVGYTREGGGGPPPPLRLNVVRTPLPDPARRMRVAVQSRFGTRRVTVGVGHGDRVGGLRGRLRGLPHERFPLPARYYFVHNGSAMDEDGTFRSHDVKHCDTVEIFPGDRPPVATAPQGGGS